MQELNYLTMITAVRNCVETDGFRVGIFIRTRADENRVLSDILQSMDDEEMGAYSRVRRTTNRNIIEFRNGSWIRVLGASENSRGLAFHKVLYEPDIDHEALCVVRYTEKLRF